MSYVNTCLQLLKLIEVLIEVSWHIVLINEVLVLFMVLYGVYSYYHFNATCTMYRGNTTLQVHPWEKRQFRFIQPKNQVKNLLFLPTTVIPSPRKPPYPSLTEKSAKLLLEMWSTPTFSSILNWMYLLYWPELTFFHGLTWRGHICLYMVTWWIYRTMLYYQQFPQKLCQFFK